MAKSGLYHHLDTSVPEIRLFTLFPARLGAPVVGQLEVVPLSSPPPYESLSYAWGEPRFIKPIAVNDQTLLVTPNLDAALRALRQEATPRLLWIDAICINQGSLTERGHQVTLMRTIYTRCERDLLWLGPNAPLGTQADPGEDILGQGMELMARIAGKDISVLRVMGRNWTSHRRLSLERGLRSIRNMEDRDLYVELAAQIPRMEEDLASIRDDEETSDTLSSDWLLSPEEQGLLYKTFIAPLVWTRLWVMQELALAPKIQLVAGRHTLDWDTVSGFLGDSPYADAFHGTFSHNTVHRAVGMMFKTAQTIDHQRRIVREVSAGRQVSTLLDVLARFRDTQSSDLRDKIYGVLGLVSSGLNIEISYEITHQQLFTNVSAALINESGNLDIICQRPWTSNTRFGPYSNNRENLSGDQLPSWAADFSQGGEIHLFAQRSIFTAGKPSCEVSCRVIDGKVLHTRGTVLGRVGPILQQDYLNSSRGYQGSDCLPLEWLKLYLKPDEPSASRLDDVYMTGEPALTAFWRTLVLDCAAYPMIRLTEDQVEEEDAVIKSTWLQKTHETSDPETESSSSNGSPFINHGIATLWRNVCGTWTFSITENGLYVLLMPPAKEGDVIACLDGGKVPVILRAVEGSGGGEEERYRFINVAYVHGLMDFGAGESAGHREKLGLIDQEFWLV